MVWCLHAAMCRGVILVFTPEGCCRREGVTEQTAGLVNSSSCLWHGCILSSLKVELATSSDLSTPCTHFGGWITGIIILTYLHVVGLPVSPLCSRAVSLQCGWHQCFFVDEFITCKS